MSMFLPEGPYQTQPPSGVADITPAEPETTSGDIALMQRVFAAAMRNPNLIPSDFMSYLVDFIQISGLVIPIGQVFGYAQKSQSTRVHLAVNQSIASGSQETVLFDTVDYDYGGLWDAANHMLVVKTAGKYIVGGGVLFGANTTGSRIAFVKRGTSGAAPSSLIADIAVQAVADPTVGTDLPVVTSYDLAANDTLNLTVIQDSGGSLDLLADTRTNLWIARIGP